MPVPNRDFALSIIGDGKVGRTIFRYVKARGLAVDCMVVRNSDRIKALSDRIPDVRIVDSPAAISRRTRVILICVQDRYIADAARQLLEADIDLAQMLIAHTSGLRTSDELSSLSGTKAVYGSLHPIQSFHTPDMEPGLLEGIACGIEGGEGFRERATAFAAMVGWNPVFVSKEQKSLYHAACVFAGNFLVALAADAASILGHATENTGAIQHLLPMMQTVLARLHDIPPAQALTGPAARGDVKTMAIHIAALSEAHPKLADIYASWTQRIMDMTQMDDEMRRKMFDALKPPAG